MKQLPSFRLLTAVFALILSLTFTVSAQAKAKRPAADEVTVTGTVTDVNGQPVTGVAVTMEGTWHGTVTDRYGKYTVSVPENAVLVFSSIGYKDLKVAMNGKCVIDVIIDFASDPLKDELVVGYGTQRKELTTNASLQVRGADISKLSTTSALGALQSQTPGVSITSNSGQPGSGYDVKIRGVGTWNDYAPLYVIDGVPGGDINLLNPNDIESIDVLKDAGSAAIYGARAANGVILVTTKRGKEGRTVVSYDGYIGWQYIAKTPSLLNANDYMLIQDELSWNTRSEKFDWESALPEQYLTYDKEKTRWNYNGEGTDWFKELYANKGALTRNHSLNVTGGSSRHTFSLGLSYTDQDGTLGANDTYAKYKRATFRANSDHVAVRNKRGDLDILKFGETVMFSAVKNNGLAEGNIYNNSIHNALSANPLTPLYADATWGDKYYDKEVREYEGWNYDLSTRNPHPIAMDDYTPMGRNETKFYNLTANVYAQVEPIKNLKFRSQFGYNLYANEYRSYLQKYALSDVNFANYDGASQSLAIRQRFTWENTISYHFDVKKNSFDFMIGQSIEKYNIGTKMETSVLDGDDAEWFKGWESAYISYARPNSMNQIAISGYPEKPIAYSSFFGRINYNYDERYILSATLRADVSSTLKIGNDSYDYYPSVSAGWIMTNERWMKPISKWLSFLKIRASWGRTANSNADDLIYSWPSDNGSASAVGSMAYYFDKSNPTRGVGGGGLYNSGDNFKRETTDQADIGLDVRLFDSRLGISADAYTKTTRNLILDYLNSYLQHRYRHNGGEIRNSGVELSLDWGERRGDFTYGINLNGAWNKNEVLSISKNEQMLHGQEDVLGSGSGEIYRVSVGEPLGYFYGYKTAGVWQTQAQIDEARAAGKTVPTGTQVGDLIFVDTNGDGVINDDDRTKLGDPTPDFTAGMNLSFGYKGFDLGITGYGAFGQQIVKCWRTFGSPGDNYTSEILGRWHGEGTSNRLPRLSSPSFSRNWSEFTDLYVENGDYFKISNITLGYDFARLLKTPVISRLRLYFTVQNPFTFTKYSGMDPEVTYRAGEYWASGIDLGYYPNPRIYLMGVNVQF